MLKITVLQNHIESAIKYDLEDDPYAKLRFSVIVKQKLSMVNTLPLKNRYKPLIILKKQIDERYLEEIPLAIANLPNKDIRQRQQAYYGILLLCLNSNLTINDTQQLTTDQLVTYAINIDKLIENNKFKQPQHEDTLKQISLQLLSLFINNNFNLKIAKKIVKTIITVRGQGKTTDP